MSTVLADTHAVLWHLGEPARLSKPADAALNAAIKGGDFILVSAVSVAEARYLAEKGKIAAGACAQLIATLKDPATALRLVPVDMSVVEVMDQIPRQIVPDFPDRIIAATALALNVPLVTADAKLHAAPIQTIW